jgi:hypothetical protein
VSSASFSTRDSRFNFASSLSAADRSFTLRWSTTTTGRRDRV